MSEPFEPAPASRPEDSRPRAGRSEDSRSRGDRTEAPGEDREERVRGVLFLVKDGYGFLRQVKNSYLSGPGDVYVPKNVIQRYRIRSGSEVEGILGRGRRGKKKRPLESVSSINGRAPEEHARTKQWKDHTSVDPTRRIRLETKNGDPTLRAVDLVTPLGFGSRALVVGPPRTGKTFLLQKLANAVQENHPTARVLILLPDSRPEEVTEYRRACPRAEVVASTIEMEPADHVTLGELVLDRARRLGEIGNDVVLLIDSLTRLARAFNTERGRTARATVGGLDVATLGKPREIFGAARAAERGGTLTIVATALADDDSKLDQAIYDEFKGTGNLELALSGEVALRRVFPAIDVKGSSTRREERLRHPDEQRLATSMRRALLRHPPVKAMETLRDRLKATQLNAEFLQQLAKQGL